MDHVTHYHLFKIYKDRWQTIALWLTSHLWLQNSQDSWHRISSILCQLWVSHGFSLLKLLLIFVMTVGCETSLPEKDVTENWLFLLEFCGSLPFSENRTRTRRRTTTKDRLRCVVARMIFCESAWAREKQRTETFALIGGAVDVDLGANNAAERHEHLCQLRVSELLRQVIYEQITALRSCAIQFGPQRQTNR